MAEDAHAQWVTYAREGHIGVITLNRPEKRNALNPAVWTALDRILEQADADEEARVILLTGAGPSFCAGLDLSPDNEIFAMLGQPASAAQKTVFYREVRKAQAVHDHLEQLRQPTIAVIQGHCLGAGLELAVCCDMLYASAGTVFGLPEAKLAFITDVGGLQRLNRLVGRVYTREMAFRAHRIDTARARAMGLLNDVFPDPASLAEGVRAIAAEIAGNPPLAVQGAKAVLRFDETACLEDSLDYNAARSSMIVPSEDQAEAVAAYLEKRPGRFTGR